MYLYWKKKCIMKMTKAQKITQSILILSIPVFLIFNSILLLDSGDSLVSTVNAQQQQSPNLVLQTPNLPSQQSNQDSQQQIPSQLPSSTTNTQQSNTSNLSAQINPQPVFRYPSLVVVTHILNVTNNSNDTISIPLDNGQNMTI